MITFSLGLVAGILLTTIIATALVVWFFLKVFSL